MARGETLGIVHVQYNRSESAKGTEAFESLQQSQQRLAVAVSGQVGLSLASLQLRETLREQSIRDPLTGSFNRRFMQESLDRELLRAARKQRPLAVVFVDLDHFKLFNDTFGHDAGDEVLRSISEVLRTHYRGDDVVCRYGGEEFAIILPESTAREAANRTEDLRDTVKNLKIVHKHCAGRIGRAAVGTAGDGSAGFQRLGYLMQFPGQAAQRLLNALVLGDF
jgi:diguanylate cyclase (GGDEF)-like protein